MGLKVPLALDADGDEIRPEQADVGTTYFCASCHGRVYVRRGETRRAHFAHYVDPVYCEFTHESEAHLRAKWAIKAAVESGNTTHAFQRTCQRCSIVGAQSLPGGLRGVLEYALPSGHRADVALLDGSGQVRAIIEVLETHAVEPEKAESLRPYRWAEIEASVILAQTKWQLTQDHFAPYLCPRCRMIDRYGVLYPMQGQTKQQVVCPLHKGHMVNAIDDCAACDHFADVRNAAIYCTGAAVHASRR